MKKLIALILITLSTAVAAEDDSESVGFLAGEYLAAGIGLDTMKRSCPMFGHIKVGYKTAMNDLHERLPSKFMLELEEYINENGKKDFASVRDEVVPKLYGEMNAKVGKEAVTGPRN